MNATKIEAELHAATRQAFEDLCFMFPAPELAEGQSVSPVAATAVVRFRGEVCGELLLRVTPGLFSAIAANMLGLANPPVEQQYDALGEITNVICGNILPEISSGRTGYCIEAPRMADNDLRSLGQPEAALAEVTINLNLGRAELLLFVDGSFERNEALT